jgi:molecular chaperone DnaK
MLTPSPPILPPAASPPPLPRTLPRQGPSQRPAPPVPRTRPLPPVGKVPELPRPAPEPLAAQPPVAGWVASPVAADAHDVSIDHDWTQSDSSAGTNPAAWLMDEAAARPLSDAFPLAPPTASTLVSIIPAAPGVATRGPGAQTIVAEPAATPRGLRTPQSYPIQPPAPLPLPPMPTRPAPVVLEVTPRGLGIATVAGYCEELIRRNSRLPTETKKLFTTSRDQQDLVRIVVCQGESRRLDGNTVVGDLVLQNLPRRPRGETSIEVTFALDASGILHVQARDAQTGVEQRATLDLVGGVAQDDVIASRDRLQQLRR